VGTSWHTSYTTEKPKGTYFVEKLLVRIILCSTELQKDDKELVSKTYQKLADAVFYNG
jgi:hypothetical protein